MESQGGEEAEKEYAGLTVDCSKQNLKRIERADVNEQLAETLILDHNEIQKLDNLETYPNLKKLSISDNLLIRMYGVSTLVHLTSINISNNSLVIIEGLKHLKELRELNLAKNRLKTIEQLKSNLKLEKLDLSGNSIGSFSDLSFLGNLKELRMHNNRIVHLSNCERYLPVCLEVLTLNDNLVADLNEVSYLGHLIYLKELSLLNNPCLKFSEDQKFNYRPFVKNWISSLVALDGSPLDDIECLKGEWLYSHGRGRSFRPGEHAALIEYLMSVCPREGGESVETEDVKKLKLILSKAQLHQQQLREQLTTEGPRNTTVKKKASVTLEKMFTSFQDSPAKDPRVTSELMTRSLDSGMVKRFSKYSKSDLTHTPLQTSTTFLPIPDTLISPDVGQPGGYPGPQSSSNRTSRSSSRNSNHSTPETKWKSSVLVLQRRSEISPPGQKKGGKLTNCRSSTPLEMSGNRIRHASNVISPKKGSRSRESEKNHRDTSEEEESEILTMKLEGIQDKVNQLRHERKHQADKPQGRAETHKEKGLGKARRGRSVSPYLKDPKAWKAAVCIQRRWRGYRARNLNGEVITGCKNIQMSRMQDYITKVVSDMEATRVALEGNRKLVILQMQAINSIWKKLAALQPSIGSSPGENQACLKNLMDTCSTLNKQMEGLQAMVKSMQASSNSNALIPMATQTEIVAVHTPKDESREAFPYTPITPVQKSTSENSTCDDLIDEEKALNESDHDSTGKALAEIFGSVRMEDSTLNDDSASGPGEVVVFGEKLTKPTIKLNEINSEVPEIKEEEKEIPENTKEKPKEDSELGDSCNS